MRCLFHPLTWLIAGVLAVPAAAHAAGAWTTYLRSLNYTDLAVRGDTVWCATLEGGLLRFDRAGGAFTRHTREPDGLASNQLTALAFDRSGRLWVGTADKGVSRLSADRSRWDLVNTLDGLPAGAVNAIEPEGDTLWIGTEHGVALWDGTEIGGAVPDGINPSPFVSDHVGGIAVRGDSLWVGTQKGLYASRRSTGLVTWDYVNAGLPDSSAVDAVAFDGRTLMVLVLASVYRFDPSQGRFGLSGGIGSVFRLSDDGGAIVATSEQGIFRWGAGWEPLNTGLVPQLAPYDGATIYAAAADGAGRYFAANRTGLYESDTPSWAQHVPDAPVGNNINNVLIDSQRVYVATFAEGVARFDGQRWRNWPGVYCGPTCDTTFFSPAYAFSLLLDRQGKKWVGTWSGAMEEFDDLVSPPQFVHHRPSDSLGVDRHTFGWSAAADTNGGRWFGMDSPSVGDIIPIGIEYYDSAGDYRANYRPENTPAMQGSQIRALAVDRFHRMWVGYAQEGVDVFAIPGPGGPLVGVPSASGDVPFTNTLDVFGIVAYGDSVWVMSTADLRRFSPTSFTQQGTTLLIPANPAPRGACHPLEVGPDGAVWVGTGAGVRVYHPGGAMEDFDATNSPLANDEVRAIRVDQGSGVAWIGTAAGLNRYDPYYVPPPPPPIPSLTVRVFPNPATLTGAGVSLRLAGNASEYRGAIYDIGGRIVRRFASANGSVFWDGRDQGGALVKPGLYFVRAEAGGRARTARVALVR